MERATEKTLVIKVGAAGDVVRTTPVLHVLRGDVTWVTSEENKPLLPDDHPSLTRILGLREAGSALRGERFTRVLSLDDDDDAARLATGVRSDDLVGAYIDRSRNVAYSDSSAGWFDMGLISRHGREEADRRKKENTLTYQEILFGMLGERFSGEECLVRTETRAERAPALVGIEQNAGERWPTKRWNRYGELAAMLRAAGVPVTVFRRRPTLAEYICDIDSCSLIVTGDTLALHLGLALRTAVVGIFTCTSAAEICGYGRMVKVVSPYLAEAFYRREYVPRAVDGVTLQDVTAAIRACGYGTTGSFIAPAAE